VRTALWAELPAKREFYREIWRFLLAFTDGAARHPTQLTALSSLWRAVVAQKEQGIFSEYQGIKVPCYVLVQRKFRQKHTLLIEGSGRAMIGIVCEAYPSVAFNNCGIGTIQKQPSFCPVGVFRHLGKCQESLNPWMVFKTRGEVPFASQEDKARTSGKR